MFMFTMVDFDRLCNFRLDKNKLSENRSSAKIQIGFQNSKTRVQMENVQRRCKLCSNIIADGSFTEIDDVIKNMFDNLLLKLSFNEEAQHVMCNVCFSNLNDAFNFKSICLHTDIGEPKPVVNSMSNDLNPCRICGQPVSSNHRPIQKILLDNINLFIPERNFELTTIPATCIKCLDSLCAHSNFIRNCIDNEKKINMNESLANFNIKTEYIEVKSESMDEMDVPDLIHYNDIKREMHEEGQTSFHPVNEYTNTEETEDGRNSSLQKQESIQNDFPEVQMHQGSEVQMYKCDKCTYETKLQKYLTSHQLRHEDPSRMQTYHCDECDFKTIRKGSLKTHQLTHKDPSEVQTYKCGECDFKSIRKHNLIAHELRHKDPTQLQAYLCNECDYRSVSKRNLNRHQLTHRDPSEIITYTCDECEFITKRKECLTQHKLRHKDPSEVQMYECKDCDYKSILKGNLLKHQLRHKDPAEVRMFHCDECDYKSLQKGNLLAHQLKHKDSSQVQVYRCDECDYKCVKKINLKRHQLRHKDPSQVQIYKCGECDYTCIRTGNLKRHQLRHKVPTQSKKST